MMNAMTIGLAAALAIGSGDAAARYVFEHERWSAATQSVATSEASVSLDSKACATRATMRHLQGAEREAFLADCNNNTKN